MVIISNSKTESYEGFSQSFIDFLKYKNIDELQNKKWINIISKTDHWKLEVLKKAKYNLQFGALPNTWEILTKNYQKKYITTDVKDRGTDNQNSIIYHNILEATVEDWNISNLVWLRRLEDILHNDIIYND